MKAAKASHEDVDQMRKFLFALDDMVNSPESSIHDIGTFCHAHFNNKCGRHFQRILFGYDTLVENACDPDLSYLDWKPEIKEAITAFQHRVVSTDPTNTQIQELLEQWKKTKDGAMSYEQAGVFARSSVEDFVKWLSQI